MSLPRINYLNYVLPFLANAVEDKQKTVDATDIESFVRLIPDSAIFVGLIDDEVSNWTSWKVEDHYYILPLEDSKFDWAMFRISWDDNHECFDWSDDARIKGVSDPTEAARRMARGLFARWEKDLRKSENAAYREFLELI